MTNADLTLSRVQDVERVEVADENSKEENQPKTKPTNEPEHFHGKSARAQIERLKNESAEVQIELLKNEWIDLKLKGFLHAMGPSRREYQDLVRTFLDTGEHNNLQYVWSESIVDFFGDDDAIEDIREHAGDAFELENWLHEQSIEFSHMKVRQIGPK